MSSDIPAGVEIESVFLVEAQYTPDAAEKRPRRSRRAPHPCRRSHEGRIIIEAGAYSDR